MLLLVDTFTAECVITAPSKVSLSVYTEQLEIAPTGHWALVPRQWPNSVIRGRIELALLHQKLPLISRTNLVYNLYWLWVNFCQCSPHAHRFIGGCYDFGYGLKARPYLRLRSSLGELYTVFRLFHCHTS